MYRHYPCFCAFLKIQNNRWFSKAAAYGWLLTAVTAASPLLDSSYMEKDKIGEDTFNGLASTRCSELGYWNYFAPIVNSPT